MRKFTIGISIFTIISFLSFNAKAQAFKVLGKKKMVIATAYVNRAADYTFWVKNISGSDTLRIDWMIIRNDMPSSWNPQLCDNHLCYVASALPTMGKHVTTDAFKNNDSASFAFSTTPSATSNKPDTFLVLMNVHNGKGGSTVDTLNLAISQVVTGIDEAQYGNIKLEIYPEPATDKLNIYAENLRAGSIDIYSLAGKKLQAITTGEGMQTVDIRKYTPGLYILRYQDKAGNFGIRKFTKE